MRSTARLTALALGAWLLTTSAPALSAELSETCKRTDVPSDPAEARKRARDLMVAGEAKKNGGDLKGALENFTTADCLAGVPTTALEVARVLKDLGRLVEARETTQRIIKSAVRPNEPPVFGEARVSAAELDKELESRIPTVSIVLENADTTVATQIIVDTDTLPPTALKAPHPLNAGQHTIVAKVGTAEMTQQVEVSERDRKTVTFDFKGQVGMIPSTSTKTKVLIFSGFGVAIVGIAVGSVTGIMHLSKMENDVKPNCPGRICPPEHQDDLSSATTLGNVSTIAFVAGGVGLATGIVGLLASGSRAKKEPPPPAAALHRPAAPFRPANVQAVVGPSYLGLSGTF